MDLRIDVIADTGWAAEGLAAALLRGARDPIVVRPMPLERWLGEAASPDDAADLVVALLPDASSGALMLHRLRPQMPVLWLHRAAETGAAVVALQDRPIGRLPLDASEAQLAAAVNALAHGLCVSLPDAAHPLHAVAPAAPAQELAEPLTARELEVLELMAKGLANREIAEALGISSHTAKFHVAQILDKTGSATRTEAVRQGLRLGLIGL